MHTTIAPWTQAADMTSQLLDPLTPVQAMLDGATTVIRHARFCWLVTENYESNPAVRPMGPILETDELLQLRFITDKRSRKAEQIWNNGHVQLLFSHESSDAFVILAGEAYVVTEPEAIAARWKGRYVQYFPTPEDRLNAAFIEFKPRVLKLWIRGVTPESNGFRPTVLTCRNGTEWTEGIAMASSENLFCHLGR
jgi:general stress protein 26